MQMCAGIYVCVCVCVCAGVWVYMYAGVCMGVHMCQTYAYVFRCSGAYIYSEGPARVMRTMIPWDAGEPHAGSME
jgi:hypothetical protein